MYQSFAIPSNATSAWFSVWLNVTSQKSSVSTPFDVLQVTLHDSSGTFLTSIVTLDNRNKVPSPTSYSQYSFNLMNYRGRTVRVRFLATTDSSNTTVFRIDDVRANIATP